MNPLMLKVYFRLRRGWKRLNKEAQQQVRQYLLSQRRADGYLNAGGKVDAYYTQFGRVLEALVTPLKVHWLPKKPLVVKESMGRDTIYGQFFAFLSGSRAYPTPAVGGRVGRNSSGGAALSPQTSTAVCCVLAMQHERGEALDTALVSWLKERQDETGGFRASEVTEADDPAGKPPGALVAPVPDLLSTAVALFTLRLVGARPLSASRFIEAHWLDMGSFAPTLLDDYSDVEYLFYGLLALGSDE